MDDSELDTKGKEEGKGKGKELKGKGKEEKGKERKKVHLQTDEDRAQLVKLCTKHFSRYSGEKEKFWKYI
jgi:hypothetical protein